MLKPLAAGQWRFETAAHLLNRAGFGGTPAEVEALRELGPEMAVAQLVDFEKLEAAAEPPSWARADPERQAKLRELRSADPEERRARQREEQRTQRERVQELRIWWLRRMVETRRPLEEKLALFWHGHFATSVQKVRDAWLMYRQVDLFRTHACGPWRDLLWEVTQDPAMLIWLDQAQSRRGRPNENYAREVMELFALGEGHYSEEDIQEAARALTGLTLDRIRQEPVWRPRAHDDGVKTVLGRTGDLGPEGVVDAIVAQPQSARFIVGKLWEFFVHDDPPPDVVDSLAGDLRRGGGHFGPVLKRMFRSEEFYAPAVIRTQIKSPVVWLVMALRQLERPLPQAGERVTGLLRELGQELLAPPNVKGWDGGIAWINTSSLRRRQTAAGILVASGGEPERDPSKMKAGVAESREGMTRRSMARRDDRAGQESPILRLFKPEELRDRERLMKALQRRFFQAPMRSNLATDLRDALGDDRVPSTRSIEDAVRTALQSTDYQLT